MKTIEIPTTYKPYEVPEYKEYNVPNKVVEYIEYLEKQDSFELLNRINKAIEYCEDITSRAIDISDTDYDLGQDFTARDILTILRGKDNGK